MLKFKYLIVTLLLGFLFSCNDENSLLVNPPNITETVNFRFINLANDKENRTLNLENITETQQIIYGNSSGSIKPPADTTILKIKKNSNVEYQLPFLVRYIRNSNYTFIALSGLKCANNPCPVDTVISLRTTTAIPDGSKDGFLTFLNAYPDSLTNFSIRLGCPNGEILFSNVTYKSYNLQAKSIPYGKTPVSLIKTTVGKDGNIIEEFINLFDLDLVAQGQYILIVRPNSSNVPDLFILNQNDLSSECIKPAPIVSGRNSLLRVSNLSSDVVTVNKRFTDTKLQLTNIVTDLNIDKVSKYVSMPACQSKSVDSIEIKPSASTEYYKLNSFEVLDKYTLVITDSINTKARKSYIVPPDNYLGNKSGKALIRVLNSIPNFEKLSFSLGARYENPALNEGRAFSSGSSLASELFYDDISNVKLVDPGIFPVCVFTSTDPARLIYSALGKVEADASYVLVSSINTQGEIKLALIKDTDEDESIQYLEKGVFLQFINAVPDVSYVDVSISGDLLTNAKVYYTSSFATVIKAKDQDLFVNGKLFKVQTDDSLRAVVVASGSASNIDIYANYFKPILPNFNKQFQFRFVNASSDVPILSIREQDTTSAVIKDAAEYKEFTDYRQENRERKISYYFFNGDSQFYNNKIGDVLLTIGKSYLIIFAGKSSNSCQKEYDKLKKIEPTCYSIILQQEF